MEQKQLSAEIRSTATEIRGFFKREMQLVSAPMLTGVEGITLAYIFQCLGRGKKLVAGDIVSRFRLSKATVSQTLSSLVEKNVIRQSVSKEDHRVKFITLTEKGEEIMARFQTMFETIDRSVIGGLSQAEQEELSRLLAAVRANIKKAEEEIHERKNSEASEETPE